MVKLKAATLLETLVATMLILVIFLISGLIINNLAKNTFQNNHYSIEVEMKRLGYFSANGQLVMPYKSEYKNWHIRVTQESNTDLINIEAWRKNGSKTLKRTIYAVE